MYAIEQGVVTKTTASRLKETETQIEEIEKQILIEKSRTNIKIPEAVICEYYANILEFEPLILINTLIKAITLYDDKIEITFNKPILKSPDDDRGFLFYTETNQIFYTNQHENIHEMRDIRINFCL